MRVSPAVQQIVFFAFLITWMGVGASLGLRMRAKQNALLRQFEGEIDFLIGDPIFIPTSLLAYRAAGRVMRQPHADAKIERLRREMIRRFRAYLIWIFGFPLLCALVGALLISTGLVHPY